ELLVVIVIISILIGLMLPVLSHVRETTRKTAARDTVGQLVVCWKSYLNDYRCFPDESLTEMDLLAVSILAGSNYNHKGFAYMEFTAEQMTNGLVDPWGNRYQIALDNGVSPRDDTGAYDGKVTPFGAEVRRPVLVWSKGPDKSDVDAEARKDDLRNWREGE
ncbi:MAG: hypothetical protein JXN60_04235, partial [Lentisphaerae bacterium]|nr:hypothetical protein [Lentisphaerota bacterium]